MAIEGIQDAFNKYGARLNNVRWSVSAWASDDTLVISAWDHHRRKNSPTGTLEFSGAADRWSGNGNTEFRENISKAFKQSSKLRLVIVRTKETSHIESGKDASEVKKDFSVREDLIGKVIEWDGNNYAFQFEKI